MPPAGAPITPGNLAGLTLLARWGRGVINDVAYSPDRSLLAVATTSGRPTSSTSMVAGGYPRPAGLSGWRDLRGRSAYSTVISCCMPSTKCGGPSPLLLLFWGRKQMAR